jgi:P pilus assembly chaperone PapD
MRIRLIITLLFSSICFFCSAQDFEVAPAKLNFDCEPGQIQTKIVTIQNHSNQKQQFSLTASDIKAEGDTSKTVNKDRSCKDWITVNPSLSELNPNESKDITVIMQVPPGKSKTCWAIIYVTPTEEQTSADAAKVLKTGIRLKPRIGIKVIQSPKSNTNYKASLTDLKEITKTKDSLRTFEVKVNNLGDKVVEGKLYLVLSDLTTAKEIKAKPLKINVLPDNKKTAKLIVPKNVPAGKYSLAAILDYGNNTPLEAVQSTIEIK